MARTARGPRALAAMAAVGAGAWYVAGCAAGSSGSDETGPVRFAIEVEGTHAEPVWVQLVSESEPVGWVTVSGREGRLYLEPRCEVPDCGARPVVCGAAIPQVRRVAEGGAAASVEYSWDGTTSTVSEADRCERRVPAAPGAYSARFCYAPAAVLDAAGDAAAGLPGRLERVRCEERAFELGRDREVVLTLR